MTAVASPVDADGWWHNYNGTYQNPETTSIYDDRKAQYAKLLDRDRYCQSEYADDLHTVLHSLRIRSDAGIEGIRSLSDVWQNTARQRIRTRLKYNRWQYAMVLSGIDGDTRKRKIPHLHELWWIEGPVDRQQFIPAIESFNRNCEYASLTANDPDGDVIEVRSPGEIEYTDSCKPWMKERGFATTGATYVAAQLAPMVEPKAMTPGEKEWCASVSAANVQSFRLSRLQQDE